MATFRPGGARWPAIVLAGVMIVTLAIAAVAVVPRIALERARDPGLGVRGLHARGVTGAGVDVAIIDGQMRLDHVEYAHAIVHYEELDDFGGLPFDMHGPAMTSLLVGRTIGVAPEARLHYFALDFAKLTPERLAAAIDRVVARNRALPEAERVRLVSVSTGYRGDDASVVDEALGRALAEGVFVLLSVYPVDHVDPPLAIRGLGCSPWRDCARPAHYGVTPGEDEYWRERGEAVADVFERRTAHDRANGHVTLYAPASRRTVAGPRHTRDFTFDVEGGDSQWAPYLVGVLALARQVAPELRADELSSLLAEGTGDAPLPLIDPARVVAVAEARHAAAGSP